MCHHHHNISQLERSMLTFASDTVDCVKMEVIYISDSEEENVEDNQEPDSCQNISISQERKQNDSSKLICPYCGLNFSSVIILKRHMQRHECWTKQCIVKYLCGDMNSSNFLQKIRSNFVWKVRPETFVQNVRPNFTCSDTSCRQSVCLPNSLCWLWYC